VAGTGIVWSLSPDGLRAYDAANVSHELWTSTTNPNDSFGAYVKFSRATVANGKVYVGTGSNQLVVYGLHSVQPVPPVAACQNRSVSTDLNKCSAAAASVDNGSTDPDGDTFTLSQAPPAPYSEGSTDVTLTITDQYGNTAACTATVTVVDQQAPSIACPSPVIECTRRSGASVTLAPSASDNCPNLGVPVCDPPSGSTFVLGTTPFTCTATDASGNASSCNSTVMVRDTTAPTITSISAGPSVLSANSGLVPVHVSVTAADTCDPAPVCALASVMTNERSRGEEDDTTAPDVVITGPLDVELRAERRASYAIMVKCTDQSSNSSTATTTVTVQ
jgi:hypothetical protein